MKDPIERQAAIQPEQQHGRVFKGVVVEYPSYNIYPEYIGKPYFSIKYTENGQEFIGYGTYSPEVLSEYLKEYFMPSAQPEQRWIPSGEKPPEEGSYLVWMPFAPPKHRMTVAKYCGGYWNIKTLISAWMPLPEPYAERNTDETD